MRVDCKTHPTIKPAALMRELVRLVTPPSGLVLTRSPGPERRWRLASSKTVHVWPSRRTPTTCHSSMRDRAGVCCAHPDLPRSVRHTAAKRQCLISIGSLLRPPDPELSRGVGGRLPRRPPALDVVVERTDDGRGVPRLRSSSCV